MRSFITTLISSDALGERTFILHLEGCHSLAHSLPGQFVMLRGEWGRDPLLPRAFSILSADHEGESGRAQILVKAVGRGTALLEAARPGSRFTVLGPLGSSFPAPSPERWDWLVAGGVGIAPLLFHAERAVRAGLASHIRVFYGGRNARDLVLLDRMADAGIAVDLATEDGSRGIPGFVTKALARGLDGPLARGLDGVDSAPTLMACGPDPMLVAVARIAHARSLRAYLSLETQMACGIGACLGCAVPCATKPYRYTCKDGPVMDLEELRGQYAPDRKPEGGRDE